MAGKKHTHKVEMLDSKRKKRRNILRKKNVSKDTVQCVFDNFYKEQVRALFTIVTKK